MQRRVCHELISQAEAQRKVADDWASAYIRYVGGVPVAAPDNAGSLASVAPAKPTLRAKIAAAAWRGTVQRIAVAP